MPMLSEKITKYFSLDCQLCDRGSRGNSYWDSLEHSALGRRGCRNPSPQSVNPLLQNPNLLWLLQRNAFWHVQTGDTRQEKEEREIRNIEIYFKKLPLRASNVNCAASTITSVVFSKFPTTAPTRRREGIPWWEAPTATLLSVTSHLLAPAALMVRTMHFSLQPLKIDTHFLIIH